MSNQQPDSCTFCRKQLTRTYYNLPLDSRNEYPLCENCRTEVAMFDHFIDDLKTQAVNDAASWQAATAFYQHVVAQGNDKALALLNQILAVYNVQL